MNTTTEPQTPKIIRNILLICGIASSILYIFTDIFAVLIWKEYSYTSQTVSELIAYNAPTRPWVAPLFIVYALLIYAFGMGVWKSAKQRRVLRIAALLIIGKEILGLIVTLFFPIHLRGIEGTSSDIMHGKLTAVGVFLCMFPAMGFASAAFGKRFRLYSVCTIVIFIICGVWAGMYQPQYSANLPTPWMGILERINIYGYMLWIVVLATILLRDDKSIKKQW